MVPGKLVKRILHIHWYVRTPEGQHGGREEEAAQWWGQIRAKAWTEGGARLRELAARLQCICSCHLQQVPTQGEGAMGVPSLYDRRAPEVWGHGWTLYDCVFRQQIASLETADFAKVNKRLYSTTFLAYGGKGQFCTRCLMADHAQEDCVLHPGRYFPIVRLRLQSSLYWEMPWR